MPYREKPPCCRILKRAENVKFDSSTALLPMKAKKLGIPTPYTDAVVAIVSEIEEKKRPLQNNLDAMPDLPIA